MTGTTRTVLMQSRVYEVTLPKGYPTKNGVDSVLVRACSPEDARYECARVYEGVPYKTWLQAEVTLLRGWADLKGLLYRVVFLGTTQRTYTYQAVAQDGPAEVAAALTGAMVRGGLPHTTSSGNVITVAASDNQGTVPIVAGVHWPAYAPNPLTGCLFGVTAPAGLAATARSLVVPLTGPPGVPGLLVQPGTATAARRAVAAAMLPAVPNENP